MRLDGRFGEIFLETGAVGTAEDMWMRPQRGRVSHATILDDTWQVEMTLIDSAKSSLWRDIILSWRIYLEEQSHGFTVADATANSICR
jgi:hypothetical protein